MKYVCVDVALCDPVCDVENSLLIDMLTAYQYLEIMSEI